MYYTDTHEWVRKEGDSGVIGITRYAQQELGVIVYIQLPKVGQKIVAGQEICVLESTKAAADVYAPVSGVVSEINQEVAERPQIINEHPETIGWLFRITLEDPQELDHLMVDSEYLLLTQ
jgi:glycine cleavage system H protein